jgi:hypothetical protein
MATWNDVNNLNRSFDGLRETLIQNAIMRQQQAELARRDELARRMADIREQEYAGQIAAKNAATASRERLGNAAVEQRSVAAYLKNNQVLEQIAAMREKMAAVSAANAARIKAAEDSGNTKLAESIRKEVVGSFVGTMRQLLNNGASAGQAAMMGKSFSAMDGQMRTLFQQRAPAEFGLLQGMEKYGNDPDNLANPVPQSTLGQSGRANALQPSGGSDLNEGEFPEDRENSQPAGATPATPTAAAQTIAPAAGPPSDDPEPYLYPDTVENDVRSNAPPRQNAPVGSGDPGDDTDPASRAGSSGRDMTLPPSALSVSEDPSSQIPAATQIAQPTAIPTQNAPPAGQTPAGPTAADIAQAKAAMSRKNPNAVRARFKQKFGIDLPE